MLPVGSLASIREELSRTTRIEREQSMVFGGGSKCTEVDTAFVRQELLWICKWYLQSLSRTPEADRRERRDVAWSYRQLQLVALGVRRNDAPRAWSQNEQAFCSQVPCIVASQGSVSRRTPRIRSVYQCSLLLCCCLTVWLERLTLM